MRRSLLLLPLLLVPLTACSSDGTASVSGECDGREATIVGTDGDDELSGTDGPDVISAGKGNDRVDGLGGDDVICGDEGADALTGGDGDDRLLGGLDEKEAADTDYDVWNGDTLAGGPGDDHLDLGIDPEWSEGGLPETLTYAGAAGGVTVDLAAGTATGEGTDEIVGTVRELHGSGHDDRLLGGGNADTIFGGGGGDEIDGRAGDDFLTASVPNPQDREADPDAGTTNTIRGGTGNDWVQSDAGNDVVDGGPGGDGVHGGLGRDRVTGGRGDDNLSDTVVPAPGQSIAGGAGVDTLDGAHPSRQRIGGRIDLAAGRAVLPFPSGRVTVALSGIENARASLGPWVLVGDDGPNELWASDDHNPVTIHAAGGDDVLFGSFERDLLDGGPGTDRAEFWPPRPDRMVSVEKVPAKP